MLCNQLIIFGLVITFLGIPADCGIIIHENKGKSETVTTAIPVLVTTEKTANVFVGPTPTCPPGTVISQDGFCKPVYRYRVCYGNFLVSLLSKNSEEFLWNKMKLSIR